MFGGRRSFNQDQAAETVHSAIDQATALAQNLVDQATSRAAEGAQKARTTGSSVTGQASERFDQVAKTFERSIAPSVKDVAVQAATVALELWQSAMDKAEHVIETGKTELPEAANHALGAAGDAGIKAKEASKHAVSATAGAGKSTGSVLLWAGAATGLVLYGVLQKERRDQVLRYAHSALSMTRDLISDYRGQDGSFDAKAA